MVTRGGAEGKASAVVLLGGGSNYHCTKPVAIARGLHRTLHCVVAMERYFVAPGTCRSYCSAVMSQQLGGFPTGCGASERVDGCRKGNSWCTGLAIGLFASARPRWNRWFHSSGKPFAGAILRLTGCAVNTDARSTGSRDSPVSRSQIRVRPLRRSGCYRGPSAGEPVRKSPRRPSTLRRIMPTAAGDCFHSWRVWPGNYAIPPAFRSFSRSRTLLAIPTLASFGASVTSILTTSSNIVTRSAHCGWNDSPVVLVGLWTDSTSVNSNEP